MNITFLGGTGFVGSNLVNQLSSTENNITILTRSRENNKNMLVYPKHYINPHNYPQNLPEIYFFNQLVS